MSSLCDLSSRVWLVPSPCTGHFILPERVKDSPKRASSWVMCRVDSFIMISFSTATRSDLAFCFLFCVQKMKWLKLARRSVSSGCFGSFTEKFMIIFLSCSSFSSSFLRFSLAILDFIWRNWKVLWEVNDWLEQSRKNVRFLSTSARLDGCRCVLSCGGWVTWNIWILSSPLRRKANKAEKKELREKVANRTSTSQMTHAKLCVAAKSTCRVEKSCSKHS